MLQETKNCQNCKNDFIIEPEDFLFYEKIKVPPPTFCPECRMVRRLCWRNEMNLFKKDCNIPGHNEKLISLYPPESEIKIYDNQYWWGDEWDSMSFGVDYDFSKSFFEQWNEFRNNVPFQALSNSSAVNSDYCNIAHESKDSYMCSGSWGIENSFYLNRVRKIKDCIDCYIINNSELCFDSVAISDSYHLLYSIQSKNCVDSYFLYDCVNCTDCLGCTNLRSKSYCMWNEQLSAEEYKKRISEIDLDSYKNVQALKEKFLSLYLQSLHRANFKVNTLNSSGDNLIDVKNSQYCFDCTDILENSKYVHWGGFNSKDCYDGGPGVFLSENNYEFFDAGGVSLYFCSVVYYSSEVQYSFNCYNSNNLFACIGLRNKKYCILNKQYTKEEYEELVPKIIKHMNDMPYIDSKGRVYKYGEFFPSELSPFAYNQTQAQDYFPSTKEKAQELGYKWKELNKLDYIPTMKSQDLKDKLSDVDDSILKEVIQCLNFDKNNLYCRGSFKITSGEFNLYKRLKVPLPRLCFFCRHEERLAKRNPMKLWHRSCMCDKDKHGHVGKCTEEFETSYAPDRPEIVYCEGCYNKEVY
ncbi:MAG: hypothetical protein K9L98_02780 [Candidatus Pacebacteria bacterium]|nr:hypothetical protein [Candidatus Paceibacterota bacterium]MCF7862910.1 hypothetical protein [Candidatus Paceibacterota bacterium]